MIDIVCYRRYGHNEGDDPSYTQPLMYQAIERHRSVRKLFTESLVKRGDITLDEAEAALDDFQHRLQQALDETRSAAPAFVQAPRPPAPIGVLPHVDTGVPRAELDRIFDHFTDYPEGFTPHPKLARQFEARSKLYHEQGQVEWATAELLAFGDAGRRRATRSAWPGEDSRRGTFSQRHASLVDYVTGKTWVPIATLPGKKAKFWVYDSLLSEFAALGFEYGYSVANKDAFVAWEAQFGDFMNGAQTIIDQYIVAAEDKWDQTSGLVMLLPHGYEGQGPEHSSARIERFLTLSAEDNVQVANATTAAQYFHLLRRQMLREVRKPLFDFTPKSYLRRPESRSLRGRAGERIVPGGPRRPGHRRSRGRPAAGLLLGQGGVRRAGSPGQGRAGRGGRAHRAAVPVPPGAAAGHPRALLERQGSGVVAGGAREHGPLAVHVPPRPPDQGVGLLAAVVARVESGSPATGSAKIHDQEQQELLDQTFRDL